MNTQQLEAARRLQQAAEELHERHTKRLDHIVAQLDCMLGFARQERDKEAELYQHKAAAAAYRERARVYHAVALETAAQDASIAERTNDKSAELQEDTYQLGSAVGALFQLRAGDMISAIYTLLGISKNVLDIPSAEDAAEPSAQAQAQRLYLQADAHANNAHYAAQRAESYIDPAWIDGSEEGITRRASFARLESERAHAATEGATTAALRAATIAANHPDERDTIAAGVMALASLIEAAKRHQRTLQAQRNIAKAPRADVAAMIADAAEEESAQL